MGTESGSTSAGWASPTLTSRSRACEKCRWGTWRPSSTGRGGIQLTRNFRKARKYRLALHPCVYFTNTNEEAISRLRGWLGCGCVTRRRQRDRRHKDTLALSITGTRNVLLILRLLNPYLVIKRKQAELLIRFCESRLSHYRSGDRRFNREEVRIYTELKRLNMKGGKIRRQHTDR